ncbi:MAG: NADP-dependent methylenetetrahydromethanopterin/methylenetetrahydrofolate dehydrogenase [Pirellulaceae bacterium]|nr:NADP-dependent methylenetetrahydromethanopterin/methylenetetrahydrofolate dehydrogenase [Pirellulaceae bacterium]
MSTKPKILIQFDSDQHPSVFDSVVAIDSGVDQLLPFGSMEAVDVRELVHGAMFTRGGDSLKRTAIFIGGSRVKSAEQILRAVVDCFFGNVRVSVMLDANGANTTASAAVLCLQRHLSVNEITVGVLGATGSVGQRVCRLLSSQGANVRIGSRSLQRATSLASRIQDSGGCGSLTPMTTDGPHNLEQFIQDCDAIIATGAAGVQLLKKEKWQDLSACKVAIDLNAVPPEGIEGIDVTSAGQVTAGKLVYGAIGVGNLKMKIHKRAIATLFESNDHILDLDAVYDIGKKLEEASDF